MAFTLHIDANRNWGGGQEQSLGLALALAARGEETHFIAQTGSDLASRLASSDLPSQTMPLRGLAGLAGVPRLAGQLRRLRPDVVHLHDAASQVPAGLAARRAGCPAVIVTRRTALPLRRGWIGRLKYKLWCDRLICISEAVRRRCLEAGLPPQQLTVIPDFVDCRHFDLSALPPAVRDRAPTIAVVARLAAGKGHAVLLRAMQGVVRAVPKVRLVVCGKGQEEAQLRRRSEDLGLYANVQWMGFVPDVRVVLSGADIFVMPSLSEGLAVSVLEAMAMSLPVVASEVGGLPEAVAHGETGLIVPPGDERALAEALIALLQDSPRARQMGEAGRRRALSHFDRPRIVDRVLALYQEVLGERGQCRT